MNKIHKIKLIAAATTVAMITTPVFAANKTSHYKDEPFTKSFPVTIPAMPGGFEFSAEGIYAQPNTSPFTQYSSIQEVVTENNRIFDVRNLPLDYEWAYKLGVGYVFNQTGNDIQINWAHLDNSTNKTFNVYGSTDDSIEEIRFTPGYAQSLNSNGSSTHTLRVNDSGPDSAHTTASLDFVHDSVDLDVGQYVNFGQNLSTRWLIGARYAKIKGTNGTNSTGTEQKGTVDAGTFITIATLKNQFIGLGPRVGFSANYQVAYGVGIVGEASGFILAGTSHLSVDTYNNSSVTGIYNQSFTTDANKMIPGFDSKLALNYVYMMPSNKLYYLEIEGGYQITSYLNALGVPISTAGSQDTDFTYGGPYLGVNLRFS